MPDILPDILVIAAVILAALVGFTIAGVAGFGGGVVTLPVLIWALGIREAVPVMALSQLIGQLTRGWLNREEISWPVVKWFTAGALPLAVLGSLIFVSVPTSILVRFLGVLMLLIVVLPRISKGPKLRMKLWGFAPVGATSGFLSAFLGMPGPLLAAFYLSYGLLAGAYIGTAAVGMLLIQVPKLVVYGGSGLLGVRTVALGLAIGVVAALASWAGQRIMRRVPQRLFPALINGMLLTVGLLFLVRG
ncbi:MAG: sulfite exporter TauE/SafE family protein [Dehalococcoidia bacterium]|nr:sulfite exporter TauE/SafE family protein [Dehalococcoidia bacterium]